MYMLLNGSHYSNYSFVDLGMNKYESKDQFVSKVYCIANNCLACLIHELSSLGTENNRISDLQKKKIQNYLII